MSLPIKALSVRQPWAWAIIHGGKDVENRTWQAVSHGLNQRGPIAIHASKTMTKVEYEDAARFMKSIGVDCPPAIELQRGGIIGETEVIDIVKDSESPWFFGPRGLVLANSTPCDFVPVKGCLGFFNWRAHMTDEIPEPARWMMPKDQPKSEPQGTLI